MQIKMFIAFVCLAGLSGCGGSSVVTPPNPGTGLAVLVGKIDQQRSVDGTLAQTRFFSPAGMVADGQGNLYVADNSSIRKVVIATGETSTLAGDHNEQGGTDGVGAAARFTSAQGVALDGSGNLYVADIGNYTIRKIEIASGTVTTVAGVAGDATQLTGAHDLEGPLGVGVDALGTGFLGGRGFWLDGTTLYFADQSDNTVDALDLLTNMVTILAGDSAKKGSTDGIGSAALFNGPSSVVGDGNGNLYVADQGNGTVRRVVIGTGAVTTVAGTAGDVTTLAVGPLPGKLPAPLYVATIPGGVTITTNGGDAVVLVAYVQ